MQLQFIIMLAEAFVILFELRALMQSSNIDYYHPVTQAVVKLTEDSKPIEFFEGMM